MLYIASKACDLQTMLRSDPLLLKETSYGHLCRISNCVAIIVMLCYSGVVSSREFSGHVSTVTSSEAPCASFPQKFAWSLKPFEKHEITELEASTLPLHCQQVSDVQVEYSG